MKLNVGCGGKPLNGYVNLDKVKYRHVDIPYDLECGGKMHWTSHDYEKEGRLLVPEGCWGHEVADNTFDEIILVHVVEHIANILPCMQELYRVAKPGCRMTIACPYGATDNADEDPTHVRRIFGNSFIYLSQAWYGENDYGYRGDWELDRVMYRLRKEHFASCKSSEEIRSRIRLFRNVVDEFVAGLVAVKPLRKAGFAPKDPLVQYKPV